MIFKPELADLIINGRKTETRRPVKGICRYEEGKHYAIQPGRGQKAIDRLLVLSVTQESLGDIDHQAARREGFTDFGEFLDYWANLYNADIGDLDMEQRVWVINFELYRPKPKSKPIGKDKVRLLANQQGRKDAGQYTSHPGAAIVREPEAIDPAIIARLPASLEAGQRWAKDRAWFQAAEVEGATLGERLDKILEESKRVGLDTTGVEWAIDRKVQQLEHRKKAA